MAASLPTAGHSLYICKIFANNDIYIYLGCNEALRRLPADILYSTERNYYRVKNHIALPLFF